MWHRGDRAGAAPILDEGLIHYENSSTRVAGLAPPLFSRWKRRSRFCAAFNLYPAEARISVRGVKSSARADTALSTVALSKAFPTKATSAFAARFGVAA